MLVDGALGAQADRRATGGRSSRPSSATAPGGCTSCSSTSRGASASSRPGLQVALFGKVDIYRGGLQMANPVVDLIGDRTGRIVPIYPQSEKAQITTWELAGWVENALERCRQRGLADPVPAAVRRRLGLIDRGDGAARHPPAGVDRREGPGPAAARVRRAAAGAAGAGDAQAGDGARRRSGITPRGRRRAGAPVPRRAAVPAHRRPAARDRRDRRRPRRAAPDAPAAAGRRRLGQDRRRRHARCSPRCRAGTRAR